MDPEHSIRSKYAKRSRESLIDELIALQSQLSAVPSPRREAAQDNHWAILESSDDGFFACDWEWRFVALNPVAENHFGRPAAELIGKNIWQETGTFIDSEIYQNFKWAWEEDRVHHFEVQSQIRPGYWAEIHLYPHNEQLEVYFRDISKRKQTEQSLKEREAFLEKLINAIPIPVFYKDREGRYTGFNHAFETFFGESRDRLIGKSVFDLYPPELAAIYHAKDNELFENKGVQQYETQFKIKHNKLHDVQFNKSVYTDSNGKTIGLIGAIMDLTERKRMEKTLQESEARLKALSDASFEAIFLSEKGVCLDQNQTAERMFGYTLKEAYGKHGSEWIVPEDRERVLENIRSGREDPYEVTALRKDSTTFPCEIQARMIDYQGRSVRVKALRDITQRKQAEAMQRQEEQRFRKIFENAGMGIAITDWEGRFRQCNPAYCRLLGYTEKELYQIAFDSLVHSEDRETNLAMIDRLKSGELDSFEIKNRFVHKKGHPVWVHKFVSIIPDKMGQPAHLMALVDDITRSKKTKALLIDLNRSLAERKQVADQRSAEIKRLALELSSAEDRERKRLAAVLHDDFQQTLAYIKIKLASLHKGAGLAASLNSVFTVIDGCIQNCRDLANELSPLLIEQRGFFGALRWLCRQMKEMHGLEVDLQTIQEAEITPIELASTLIRCIRELLFNVVKHSGETQASVQVGMDRKVMTITVEDAGRGCDYDRFGQKQLKGSAFGLFNIEDRIKILGGQMQVQSQPGEGFHATLQVPYDIPDQLREKTFRVLLADDHEVMRVGLAKLIKEQTDMKVVGLAANGKEAVDLAERIAPDVIILDVSMPVMNGIDSARQIKARLPDTTIIGLSMHADPYIHQAMLDAGCFACLNKADSANKLVETVRSLNLRKS